MQLAKFAPPLLLAAIFFVPIPAMAEFGYSVAQIFECTPRLLPTGDC
jgi:hypothetical protein